MNNTVIPQETYDVNDDLHKAVGIEEKGPKILHEMGLACHLQSRHIRPFEIDESRFSSYNRLVRVTSWCLRFIWNVKKNQKRCGCLKRNEINESIDIWDTVVQKENFAEIFEAISKNKRHSLQNLGTTLARS